MGGHTARKIPFEGFNHTVRKSNRHLPRVAFEGRGHAARLLRFAHRLNLWGFLLAITLSDHEWYNMASGNEGAICRF